MSRCEADHADLDHCHAGFGIRCVLFTMASAAGQPCERPSSNPPFGKRHELLHAHRSMGGRLIFVGLGTKRRPICHCPSVASLGSCFSDMATAPCASFLNKSWRRGRFFLVLKTTILPSVVIAGFEDGSSRPGQVQEVCNLKRQSSRTKMAI